MKQHLSLNAKNFLTFINADKRANTWIFATCGEVLLRVGRKTVISSLDLTKQIYFEYEERSDIITITRMTHII